MSFKLKYKAFGNQAILIEWPKEINDAILKDIIIFKLKIKEIENNTIEDLINGYNSLTVKYNTTIEDFKKETNSLKNLYIESRTTIESKSLTWQIPVCYDKVFGLDLESISEEKNLSTKDIINLHTKPTYKVYFIGFLPGFLYLGGLNIKLQCNRKATPRLNISKGSIGIGGSQTGIYPNDSAGGWNIIGKTPILFFDVSKINPCFANAGDNIQFVSISKTEFIEIENNIKNGSFMLKPIANG